MVMIGDQVIPLDDTFKLTVVPDAHQPVEWTFELPTEYSFTVTWLRTPWWKVRKVLCLARARARLLHEGRAYKSWQRFPLALWSVFRYG